MRATTLSGGCSLLMKHFNYSYLVASLSVLFLYCLANVSFTSLMLFDREHQMMP